MASINVNITLFKAKTHKERNYRGKSLKKDLNIIFAKLTLFLILVYRARTRHLDITFILFLNIETDRVFLGHRKAVYIGNIGQ